jgi:acyl carrier protein
MAQTPELPACARRDRRPTLALDVTRETCDTAAACPPPHGFTPDATMNPLYSTLIKLLEVDTLQPDDILRDFDNWDSLTILSLCATLDGHFGISLSAQDLKEVSTVTDLDQLIAALRAA